MYLGLGPAIPIHMHCCSSARIAMLQVQASCTVGWTVVDLSSSLTLLDVYYNIKVGSHQEVRNIATTSVG